MSTKDSALSDGVTLISTHGWAVIRVGDEVPAYAYSIGLFERFDHPEVIVFGLDLEVAQKVINTIGALVKRGERFEPMSTSNGVLEGYPVAFRKVAPAAVSHYMGLAVKYYDRRVEALHCIWPDREGRFPWQGAAADFRRLQPMLSDSPDKFTTERP